MKRLYIILIVLLIVIAAALAVILTYLDKFPGSLSNEHSHWGTFGDYIGGLLNPLISFLTLITTVIIAFEIHNLSEQEGTKQLQAQKALLKTQLQFDLLREYSSKFESQLEECIHLMAEENPVQMKILLLKARVAQILLNFQRGAMHLFQAFNNPVFETSWMESMGQVQEWMKVNENAENDIKESYAIMNKHTLTISVLYQEMLGRDVNTAVSLLGAQPD
jgi:uncharacterized membrane protein